MRKNPTTRESIELPFAVAQRISRICWTATTVEAK